jgi:hypothetical protein
MKFRKQHTSNEINEIQPGNEIQKTVAMKFRKQHVAEQKFGF